MVIVSVIVPSHNDAHRLERTLDSLQNQDVRVAYEVVVVGDRESCTVAREHRIVDRVVWDDRSDGPGAARNQGAAVSNGDLLLFTDADTVVPSTWIRAHRRHYVTREVVCVGGPLRPLEGGIRHRLLFRLLSDWWYRVSWPVGFVQVAGPNCSVRREAFEAVGGFDESLAFLEDTDLSLRLSAEGLIVYDHTVPVRTSVRRQASEGYLRLFFAYFRGYLEYVLPGRSPSRKHFGR